MRSVGFGVRAGAVFIASVVVFASMIVIAHSLRLPPETVTLRPVGGGLPAEVASDGLEGTVDLGDLRRVGAASTRARPGAVVTATPVPVDDTAPQGPAAASTPPATAERDPSAPSASSGATDAKVKKRSSRTTTAEVRPEPGKPSREPKPAKDPKPQPDPTPDPTPAPVPTPTPAPTPTPTEGPSEPPAPDAGASSEAPATP